MSIDAIRASVDSFTTKTTETVAAVNAKVDSTQAAVDRIEAVLKRPGFGGLTAVNDNSAIRAERDAVAIFCRTGDDSKLKAIQAGMSEGSSPDGGYFVLPTYSTSITKKLFDQSPMRQLARIETITSGDSFVEPIDNGETEAVWVGEKTARPATDSPQLGMLTVPAHEIYSCTPATQKIIDDAGFDLGAYLEGKSVDQFSRSEGISFITGDGVSRPRGLLSRNVVATSDATRAWADLQYVASGAAATVTADGLRNLTWAVRAPYRMGASWLMNSQTANSVDLLKDGNGTAIWRDGMQAGSPPNLLGYPVFFDESMPDLAADSLSIAFGNFKLGFLVVDRLGVRFLRDPYSDKPNVLHYCYKRVGSDVSNSQAIKLLKTQAS